MIDLSDRDVTDLAKLMRQRTNTGAGTHSDAVTLKVCEALLALKADADRYLLLRALATAGDLEARVALGQADYIGNEAGFDAWVDSLRVGELDTPRAVDWEPITVSLVDNPPDPSCRIIR